MGKNSGPGRGNSNQRKIIIPAPISGTLSFTPHGPQRNSEHKKDRAGRMGTLVRGIIRPVCRSGNSSKTLDPFSKKPLRSKKAGAPYDPGPRRSPRIIELAKGPEPLKGPRP